MKRCGNHAIINWIRAHDEFVFFNNVLPIGRVIDGRMDIPPPMDFRQWLRGANFRKIKRTQDFVKKILFRHCSIIVSMEDHDLQVRLFRNVHYEVTNILLLRDPYNMLASRIRKASLYNQSLVFPKRFNSLLTRVIQQWKAYAREYLGITSFLDNKLPIYFNTWFSDERYRRQISRKLGFEFTDKTFSEINLKHSGGSSFDTNKYDGRSHEMNVLNRTSQLNAEEKRLLNELFNDQELNELALEIMKRTVTGIDQY